MHWLSCTRSKSFDPAAQVVPGPQREGERLGEGAARERGDLGPVHPGLQLPDGRHPHREVVVVDVEAGQLVERNPLVDDRVGLARQDLDVVAQVDQRLAQMAGVDALPTHVGLAPIGQIGDAQRVVRAGSRRGEDRSSPGCMTG